MEQNVLRLTIPGNQYVQLHTTFECNPRFYVKDKNLTTS